VSPRTKKYLQAFAAVAFLIVLFVPGVFTHLPQAILAGLLLAAFGAFVWKDSRKP
jgi:MFS superfamily sulfate permease-like transporter